MKGDFSRLLVNDKYIMTLMQQGRVQTDSDLNSQVLQQWAYLKAMTATILGEHGGPAIPEFADSNEGHFEIVEETNDESDFNFKICKGNYFVDGIMCVNSESCSYLEQPISPLLKYEPPEIYAIVYLKVWLHHVTKIEDPTIREVALGGPDTTTRVQRVWQVRVAPAGNELPTEESQALTMEKWAEKIRDDYFYFIDNHLPDEEKVGSGKLTAEVVKPKESDDPCILPPEAGYRGVENQLYRVEILYPGEASLTDAEENEKEDGPEEGKAVFVWSRDNGSVVYPIDQLNSNIVTLKTLWRDDRYAIHVGDWVEIGDEFSVLHRMSLPLCRVTAVDTELMQITLAEEPP